MASLSSSMEVTSRVSTAISWRAERQRSRVVEVRDAKAGRLACQPVDQAK